MNSLRDIRNILFVCMGGIGNMVMLTPAIATLSKKWPEALLHFLIGPFGAHEVVERHPRIGTILQTTSSLARLPETIFRVRALHPDMVFPATGTNPLRSGVIALLSGAPIRAGEHFGAGAMLYTHRISWDPSGNEVRANLRLADLLAGADSADTPPTTLWTDAHDKAVALAFVNCIPSAGLRIGLHPGSGPVMSYKRWPADRFVTLARRLAAEKGAQILLFGGADESGAAARMAESIGEGCINCAGRFSVRETFEVLRHLPALVTNDSGPMHLAAAAGCRTVALFGPTDERRTGPWGPGHTVVRGECAKAPCYKGRTPLCSNVECMTSIDVDRVMSAVERAIEGPSRQGPVRE